MLPPNRWSLQTVTQKLFRGRNQHRPTEGKQIEIFNYLQLNFFATVGDFPYFFLLFVFFSNRTKSFRDGFYSSLQLSSTITWHLTTGSTTGGSLLVAAAVFICHWGCQFQSRLSCETKKNGQPLRSGFHFLGGCRGEFGTTNMPRIGGKKPTPKRAGLTR